MYVSNPQNTDFDYLPFDANKSLITGQWIYCINDDIVERLNNGLIFYVYTNKLKKNKRLVQCIDQLMTETMHVIIER